MGWSGSFLSVILFLGSAVGIHNLDRKHNPSIREMSKI
jgi:hypothetical protein